MQPTFLKTIRRTDGDGIAENLKRVTYLLVLSVSNEGSKSLHTFKPKAKAANYTIIQ